MPYGGKEIIMRIKICTKCKQEKPATYEYFPLYKKTPDGFLPWCRVCKYKQNAEYRKRNRDKFNEWDREWRCRKLASESSGEYKKRTRCNAKVGHEIKMGRIKRPEICDMCSEEAFVQAHHEDYNAPLVIKWLCRKCHINVHRKIEVKSALMGDK